MILAPLKSRLLIALAASAVLIPVVASAQSADVWRKGISTVGELKHPDGFDHFDYVNTNAPKGGTLRLSTSGTFDTLNPLLAKGEDRQASWFPLYARGIALERSGQFDRADADFQAALKLQPEQAPILNYLGYSWVDRNIRLNEGLKLIEKAVALHRDHLSDPLELMRRLGGREIAAMAGAILAARVQKVPVIIDGYVATAAASILRAANPSALDHCLIGHVSGEPGHLRAIEKLGKTPLLALGMRLGEGTGAALAAGIVKAAAACHSGMATFAQAGVSNKE